MQIKDLEVGQELAGEEQHAVLGGGSVTGLQDALAALAVGSQSNSGIGNVNVAIPLATIVQVQTPVNVDLGTELNTIVGVGLV